MPLKATALVYREVPPIMFKAITSLWFLISSPAAASQTIEMYCDHSFQGNYSGGKRLLKYEQLISGTDKAYIKTKNGWIELCSDVDTHNITLVNDLVVSCSVYLPNWMNGKRKSFVWNFKTKKLFVQTLTKTFNSETGEDGWQWRQSIGEVGSKDWIVNIGWEDAGIVYSETNCSFGP